MREHEGGAQAWRALPASLEHGLREIDPSFVDADDGGPHPLAVWAECGAMWLSGPRDGAPVAAPGTPALAVVRMLEHLRGLAAEPWRADLPGATLLGERAALAGLRRDGATSCGGATRLLRAADGLVAVSLAREDDASLVPALVEDADAPKGWEAVVPWAAGMPAVPLVERAQLLGLAAAVVPTELAARDDQAAHRGGAAGEHPVLVTRGGPRRAMPRRPLVVDLSSLWAGPLCANLLGLCGARVVKVEGRTRLDGARRGDLACYDLLHGGHASVTVDLHSPAGVDELVGLLAEADLVIEASRPRALAHLGIDPLEFVARGTVWLAITAYGRSGPWSNRVGFGDDVAAAAGLIASSGQPSFLGDAIADPITGVAAALCGALALTTDHGLLLDVSMRDVVASVVGPAWEHEVARDVSGDWWLEVDGSRYPVRPPTARPVGQAAPPPGADNERWLSSR